MRYVLKFRTTTEYDDTLAHHRTKGSKNGVRRYQYEDGSLTPLGRIHYGVGKRRYQNEDGTLTEAGKKRYARDTKDLSDKKKAKYEANPDKWVNEDLNAGRRLADESANLTNKLKNANQEAMRNQPKMKMDLSSMTDQQMRNEINRALLERQYNEMFAPKKSNKGREVANGVLATAGTVLGIGSSALTIALAIRDLQGKG